MAFGFQQIASSALPREGHGTSFNLEVSLYSSLKPVTKNGSGWSALLPGRFTLVKVYVLFVYSDISLLFLQPLHKDGS
jgi:hypothetical protein